MYNFSDKRKIVTKKSIDEVRSFLYYSAVYFKVEIEDIEFLIPIPKNVIIAHSPEIKIETIKDRNFYEIDKEKLNKLKELFKDSKIILPIFYGLYEDKGAFLSI